MFNFIGNVLKKFNMSSENLDASPTKMEKPPSTESSQQLTRQPLHHRYNLRKRPFGQPDISPTVKSSSKPPESNIIPPEEIVLDDENESKNETIQLFDDDDDDDDIIVEEVKILETRAPVGRRSSRRNLPVFPTSAPDCITFRMRTPPPVLPPLPKKERKRKRKPTPPPTLTPAQRKAEKKQRKMEKRRRAAADAAAHVPYFPHPALLPPSPNSAPPPPPKKMKLSDQPSTSTAAAHSPNTPAPPPRKKRKLSNQASTSTAVNESATQIDWWSLYLREIEERAIHRIREDKENFVVMICGAKKVGKSTFGRQLMNRLLQEGLSLYHMECDPGQTEFTPPGCLALTEIIERVEGPPYKHLRSPISCKFFGEASMSNRLEDYIDCLDQLFIDFERISRERAPSCLLVNTAGWIQGAGLNALTKISRFTKPNHIVLISPERVQPTKNSASFLAFKEIKSALTKIGHDADCRLVRTLDDFELDGQKLTSIQFREAALVSYFGYKLTTHGPTLDELKTWMSGHLRSITPYAVPMRDVHVDVVHGAMPPKYILSILNGSVVALCRYEPDEGQESTNGAKHWLDDPSLPMVLDQPVSKIQCLGFGVIRATNMETRTFYLVTPLSNDKLARVNTFLKGDISLPPAVFKCQLPANSPIHLPYLVRGTMALSIDHEELVLHHVSDMPGSWRRDKRDEELNGMSRKRDMKKRKVQGALRQELHNELAQLRAEEKEANEAGRTQEVAVENEDDKLRFFPLKGKNSG